MSGGEQQETQGRPLTAAEHAAAADRLLRAMDELEREARARRADPQTRMEDAINGVAKQVNATLEHTLHVAVAHGLTSIGMALSQEPVPGEAAQGEPGEPDELLHELAAWLQDAVGLMLAIEMDVRLSNPRRGDQVQRARLEAETLLARVVEREGEIRLTSTAGPQRWA